MGILDSHPVTQAQDRLCHPPHAIRLPGGSRPRCCRNRPGRTIDAVRQDAATRIAAAEADRNATIEQARAEASQQVSAAEADRD